MACSWLKPKREALGLTQEVVASHLQEDVKAISRWENCKSDIRKPVLYPQLAELLEVSALQLCEDHLADLEAAGQDQYAQQVREALDKLRREQHFPPVDPRPIADALEACAPTGLVNDIAARMQESSAAEQATRIAEWLSDPREKEQRPGTPERGLVALFSAINQPLEYAIARSTGQEQWAALWHFLIAVMHGGAAHDADIGAGGHYAKQGEDRAWPHRLLIDNARQLNGMRTVKLDPDEPSYRLDDSRASTRAVKFRAVTQTSVEGRVHELVKEIAATLALDKPPPPLAENTAFRDYCRVVNAALATHNSRDSHVFALCGPGSQDTDEVKSRLRDLLKNLRLFDSDDSSGESDVLRVDRDELEGWYALHLHELQQRGLSLEPRAEDKQTTDESTPQEPPMNPSAQQNNIHINVQTGDGNIATQASPDSTATQQTSTALPDPIADQIAGLIEQLLSETKERKQETKELRQAALKAQAELEADGSVSSQTQGWLQRAFAALPKADALINTGTKLVELMAKIPGAGS